MADTKIFPWGLHPLDEWIKTELNNRAGEYDFNPNLTDGKPYSGPRTAWTRVFSNGISGAAPNLEGFVMGGTNGFDASYGFKNRRITIGVDAVGNPHEILAVGGVGEYTGNDFPHRPPPSIVSVETEFSGGTNSSFNALCRTTKITWKCYSLEQLEYLTPYFLTPNITLLVEWGWNNYSNESLVDLQDIDWLYKIYSGDPDYTYKWIKQSKGNYDLAMGRINDYGYTLDAAGGYNCFTSITNANRFISGQSYHGKNSAATNPTNSSGSIKLKDFVEFVYEDIDNLGIKNKKTAVPEFSVVNMGGIGGVTTARQIRDVSNDIKVSTRGRIFKSGDAGWFDSANADSKVWFRMDLIVDIINRFFEIQFLDPDDKDTNVKGNSLDISGVVMCAHPALKSTSKNILIPNQIAPRFVTEESARKIAISPINMGGIGGVGTIREVQGPRDAATLRSIQSIGGTGTQGGKPEGAYYTLFPTIKAFIEENKFDDTYDNLHEIINPEGRSFPVYSDYVPNIGPGKVDAGYWGYLEDIYVSVELFKSLVSKNDNVRTLIEDLLQHISNSVCDISQLKLIPHTVDNTKYSVIDVNFTSITTKELAETLQRISVGAVSSAYMKSANLEIKMAPEMSNQMIMQSSSGKKTLPTGYGTANYDPKNIVYSKLSRGDRMFDRAVYTKITPANSEQNNPNSTQSKYKRLLADNSNFYTYTTGKGDAVKQYILCELDSTFMKSILLDIKNKKSIYTNNSPMPGTTFKMELLGIGGVRYLAQFTLDHVPSSYGYDRAVWQVSNVSQRIENKIWITEISAQARPLTIFK
jgi:hypothetical protein